MNKSVYQNNPNEWIVTNETGEIRLIKTNDISDGEIKNILFKEDELETLMNEKNDLMQKIAKINKDDKAAKKDNYLFLVFVALTIIMFLGLSFLKGFNPADEFMICVALVIPASLCAMFKADSIDTYGTKKIRKELINGYEKTLAKLKEREPKLIDEINMLKEKYHFIEESGELTSIPEVKEKLMESEKQNEYSLNKDDEFPKRVRRKNR